MAANPGARKNFVERYARDQERARLARIRPRRRTETKTFIIGGDIDTGLYIPPVFLNLDPEDDTGEWKRLVSCHGILETGSILVSWDLGEDTVLSGHEITTTGSTGGDIEAFFGSVPEIVPESWLQPTVYSGSGTNLSLAFTVITGR